MLKMESEKKQLAIEDSLLFQRKIKPKTSGQAHEVCPDNSGVKYF